MDVRRTSKSVAVSHDTGYVQLGVYPHSLNMDHPAPAAIVPKSVLVFAVLPAEHTLGCWNLRRLHKDHMVKGDMSLPIPQSAC
jgi:hypothetical protein